LRYIETLNDDLLITEWSQVVASHADALPDDHYRIDELLQSLKHIFSYSILNSLPNNVIYLNTIYIVRDLLHTASNCLKQVQRSAILAHISIYKNKLDGVFNDGRPTAKWFQTLKRNLLPRPSSVQAHKTLFSINNIERPASSALEFLQEMVDHYSTKFSPRYQDLNIQQLLNNINQLPPSLTQEQRSFLHFLHQKSANPPAQLRHLSDPVTMEELKQALLQGRPLKSSQDLLPYFIWRLVDDDFLSKILVNLNTLLNGTANHEAGPWLKTNIWLLTKPKFDQHPHIRHTRPIALIHSLLKAFDSVLTARVSQAVPLHPQQYGFVKNQSTFNATYDLLSSTTFVALNGRPLHLAAIDISGAFDSVLPEVAQLAMRCKGIPEAFINYATILMTESELSFLTHLGTSPSFRKRAGVLQGLGMSPFIWNCCANLVLEYICSLEVGIANTTEGTLQQQNARARAFADDFILSSTSHQSLQRLLRHAVDAFSVLNLATDASKTKLIRIAVPGFIPDPINPPPPPPPPLPDLIVPDHSKYFSTNDTVSVSWSSSIRYLGFIISDTLQPPPSLILELLHKTKLFCYRLSRRVLTPAMIFLTLDRVLLPVYPLSILSWFVPTKKLIHLMDRIDKPINNLLRKRCGTKTVFTLEARTRLGVPLLPAEVLKRGISSFISAISDSHQHRWTTLLLPFWHRVTARDNTYRFTGANSQPGAITGSHASLRASTFHEIFSLDGEHQSRRRPQSVPTERWRLLKSMFPLPILDKLKQAQLLQPAPTTQTVPQGRLLQVVTTQTISTLGSNCTQS